MQSIFSQFSSGNSEVFSISASVIAAYIFYIINSYLPRYVKRKKSLNIIGEQLTQIVYRSMCLVYVHENCRGIFSEESIKNIYKLISYDLSKKISSVSEFIDFLELEERKSINIISSYKDKFLMNHHKIDAASEKINLSLINLVTSINLPSGHIKDKEWYRIESNKISFIKKSNTFKLLLFDLQEANPNEIMQLSDFVEMIKGIMQKNETNQKIIEK